MNINVTVNQNKRSTKTKSKRGRPAIPLLEKKCHSVHGFVTARQWGRFYTFAREIDAKNFGEVLRFLADEVL